MVQCLREITCSYLPFFACDYMLYKLILWTFEHHSYMVPQEWLQKCLFILSPAWYSTAHFCPGSRNHIQCRAWQLSPSENERRWRWGQQLSLTSSLAAIAWQYFTVTNMNASLKYNARLYQCIKYMSDTFNVSWTRRLCSTLRTVASKVIFKCVILYELRYYPNGFHLCFYNYHNSDKW